MKKQKKKMTIEEKRKMQKGSDKKKVPLWKDYRNYISLVLLVSSAVILFYLWQLNVLPIKFLIPAVLVGALLVGGLFFLLYSKKVNKINHILGIVLSILFSVLMCYGAWAIVTANKTIDKISVNDGDKEYEIVSVVVEKDHKAETIEDLKDASFAIPEAIDKEHTEAAVKDINEALKTEIKTVNYANTNEQAQALFDQEVDAMILNEAYRSLLDEKFPSFQEDTKVIYEIKIEKEVKQLGESVDVNKTPYNVYITGMDTYGPIASKSRSDVNMIATINPTTHQILLTSIPRDYYIAQTCQGNQKDKLTHTGIFGVDCTVSSMENFTGLKFNYYVRVNFSSLESIVDAIGGIDIYNPQGFYSGVDGTLIPAGNIHLNGNLALKFSRERKAYADGDRQRGRNQMIVLEGIIKKAVSPAIITGYAGIMDAVGDTIQTNMTKDEMMSIIKRQLDEGGSWDIQQQSVTGPTGSDWSPANGFNSSVMYPDMESVNVALSNIDRVVKGEKITLE